MACLRTVVLVTFASRALDADRDWFAERGIPEPTSLEDLSTRVQESFPNTMYVYREEWVREWTEVVVG